jgi:Ca2+-binding EF-hand superfamily protein
MKRSTTLMAMLCTIGLALPAAAQRFPGRDANSDGQITWDEWDGTRREFRSHDQNRDGVIDGEELPARMRRQMRGRMAQDDGTYGTRNRTGPASNLDRNASGAVEGYEWPYNRNVFHKLDRDRNSVLTNDELNNISSATMTELDRNNNNRIEPDEWPGGFAQFRDLDQNNDGRLTNNEYFSRGGEWQRRQRFSEWDKDGNGFISSTEWKSRPPLFHKLDTDGDSRLSWNEFMASTDVYDRPFGWR